MVFGFALWHEIWIEDGDSAWETVLAIAQTMAICLVPLAVGIGVLLDVARFIKITSRNVKEVIVMLSELLSDALKRHRARRAEEERRQAEVAQLKQQVEQDAEEKTRLSKANTRLLERIRELEDERNGGSPRC